MSDLVGFIGTGQIGLPMAERLLKAGFPMSVYDINPAAMQPLVDRGARPAQCPRAVADSAEIVVASLPSREASRAAALGPDGLHEGGACKTYIEMSTIGSSTMKAIAAGLKEKGITLVDSPVSGGPPGVRAGTLATMVATDKATFERVKPVLSAIAGKVFHVAETPGLAQTCKLVNNLLSATNFAATCEAIAIGAKAGLDSATMIEAINASSGRNSATLDKFPRSVLPRTFDYGARMEILMKDIELGLEEAKELGVPAFILPAVRALWFYANQQGGAKQDITALMQYVERWSGVEVKGRDA